MKLLRTLNRLKDPRDLWLFLQILTTLALLPRRIRRRSLPELLGLLDPGVSPARSSRAKLDRTAGFVDSLLNYRIFRRYGRCLLRSLLLFRCLRRQGWPVGIRFGVRRAGEAEAVAGAGNPGIADGSRGIVTAGDGAATAGADRTGLPAGDGAFDITGHSWLVLGGEPFLEAEYQQELFATTFAYPAREC